MWYTQKVTSFESINPGVRLPTVMSLWDPFVMSLLRRGHHLFGVIGSLQRCIRQEVQQVQLSSIKIWGYISWISTSELSALLRIAKLGLHIAKLRHRSPMKCTTFAVFPADHQHAQWQGTGWWRGTPATYCSRHPRHVSWLGARYHSCPARTQWGSLQAVCPPHRHSANLQIQGLQC